MTALIAKLGPVVIPFFSNFFKGKLRLVIEYGLVLALLVAAALSANAYFAKKDTESKLEKVSERLILSENAIGTQAATIDDLKAMRSKDARVIDDLLSDYKRLASNDANVKRRLLELEHTNADVKDYLHQPIPAELACVLNNSCTAGRP